MSGKIVKVSGPLVVATGLKDANMADVVRVGEQRLIGEILTMNGDAASIQVYEETSGLGPGAAVETTGAPMSVELGPGIIENIYDGIQRPLEGIMKKAGSNNLPRGVEVPALDREKKWQFDAVAKPGDQVTGGDVLGTVTLSYDGKDYATVDLLALNDVEASRILTFWRDVKQFFSQTAVKVVGIILLVAIVALLLWKLVFGRRRYRYGRSVNFRSRRGYRGRRR